jgi:hypothetical protein
LAICKTSLNVTWLLAGESLHAGSTPGNRQAYPGMRKLVDERGTILTLS